MKRTNLLKDRNNKNICKGIGFINYYKKDDMEFAIYKLDNFVLGHLILKAEKASNNKKRRII